MERWDLFDLDRQRTQEIAVRGEKLPAGRYHMVVHVCVFNRRGEMLIQQRQPFKQGYPNLWDVTVGGSAVAGDTSVRAAEREVSEELGLPLDLTGRQPALTIPFDEGFDDWYLADADPDLSSLTLQYEEVQAVRWASMDEILRMIDSGEFIPYRLPLIPLLFDMHAGGEGAHRPK